MCACVFVRARGWTCVRVRTREWVSQCSKQSEAHGKASVLDESPEQATRRLCCDVRKATDRSAAKPEAPQADGWGVLMEPRLACVSAGVCGRAALRGLIMQVSWWSPWNRASQHFPTNCRCKGGSGKQRVFERGRHTCTGLCSRLKHTLLTPDPQKASPPRLSCFGSHHPTIPSLHYPEFRNLTHNDRRKGQFMNYDF